MRGRPFQLYAVARKDVACLGRFSTAKALDQARNQLPLGVYTAFRTHYGGQFLNLPDHLLRLQDSMRRYGLPHALEATAICNVLDSLVEAYAAADVRVRIDVLAEDAAASGAGAGQLISLSPFEKPPEASYIEGVRLATTGDLKRRRAAIKSADFVSQRERIRRAHPDVEDVLILSASGQILEGTSSNFYAVIGSVVHTAVEGVLAGTTRRIVLDLAEGLGMPVARRPIRVTDLQDLEEAAVSSSSRGLMPVRSVDGIKIGNGKVGPVMKALTEAYERYVLANVSSAKQGLQEYQHLTSGHR